MKRHDDKGVRHPPGSALKARVRELEEEVKDLRARLIVAEADCAKLAPAIGCLRCSECEPCARHPEVMALRREHDPNA